jgi:hypothetical protein
MKDAILTKTAFITLIVISGALFFTGCSKSTPNNNGPALAVTSLSVSTGPYTTSVTITGSGFSTTAANDQIYFNGVAASVLGASSTELLTSVPLAAGTGSVTVTVNGKTATGPTFTYQQAEVIITLAGSGSGGSANGMGMAATFSNPSGLTADASGNVYVADQGNNLVHQMVMVLLQALVLLRELHRMRPEIFM